jgi:pyrroline-5-carboxylate reductase
MTIVDHRIKMAFIGGGNMAGAIIEGLLKQGVVPADMHVVDQHVPTTERWQARGLSVSQSCDGALSHSEVWLLAVKPQQLAEVVAAAKPFLSESTLVVSVAAGINLSTLGRWLGDTEAPFTKLVRAMPNTPALVQKGMTGLAASTGVSASNKQTVEAILSAVGQVAWVESDAMIDAVTALSGSGPAYVFRFIEALIAGGEQLGLTPSLSGATELAAQSDEPLAVLRERVTSKGGTTAAALHVLDEEGFVQTITQAMQAAYDRAGALSQLLGQDDGQATKASNQKIE